MQQLQQQLERYEDFLTQDPGNIKLIGDVLDLYIQLGEFQKAKILLAKSLQDTPSDAGLIFRQATLSMATGEIDNAIKQYGKLIEQGRNDASIYYNLAYAYGLQRRFDEALAQLDTIENAADVLPESLLLRARIFHHLGNIEEALECATQYVEKQPQSADGFGELALLYLDMENYTSASEQASKALAIDAEQPEALSTEGFIALTNQDDVSARSLFDRALARHPKSGRCWTGLGLTEMFNGNLTEAIEALTKAVEYMPDHIGTWHALAWCQMSTDQLDDAAKSFETSLELDRNFAETHGGLAVIEILKGDIAEAETLTKKSLRLNPMCFAGRFANSLLKSKTGSAEEAQKSIEGILNTRLEDDGMTVQQSLSLLASKNI